MDNIEKSLESFQMNIAKLLVLLMSSNAFAVVVGPQGQNTKFYSYELAPHETLKLTFTKDKHCPEHDRSNERIEVKEFVAKNRVAPLRAISLYANSFSICSQGASGKIVKSHTISSSSVPTTVYVTVDNGISVSK